MVMAMLDTGAEYSQRPRTMPAPLRRALLLRVRALEAEQDCDRETFEALYEESDRLALQILDRQQTLRLFRELLLNRGAA